MDKEKLILLVTKAQSGDPDAINALFTEFYSVVYDFAYKTVKDESLACDITQETFLEILRTISNLQTPEAFVSWAKKITYHQCTRYFKKKKDVLVDEYEDGKDIFESVEESDSAVIPQEFLERDDFSSTIRCMVDDLSEEQRSAVMLFYFDEMTIAKIAEIQSVSEGTVKSRLNYARRSLKKSVESYEEKHGVRLHAIPFAPLFLLGLGPKKAMPQYGFLAAQQAVSTSVSGAAAATVTSAATTVSLAAKSSAGLIAKIVAGILAAGIVVSGAVFVVNKLNAVDLSDGITTKAEFDYLLEEYFPDAEYTIEHIKGDTVYKYDYDTETNPFSKYDWDNEFVLEDSNTFIIGVTTVKDIEAMGWTFKNPEDRNRVIETLGDFVEVSDDWKYMFLDESGKEITFLLYNNTDKDILAKDAVLFGVDNYQYDYEEYLNSRNLNEVHNAAAFTYADTLNQDSAIQDVFEKYGAPDDIWLDISDNDAEIEFTYFKSPYSLASMSVVFSGRNNCIVRFCLHRDFNID